MSDKLRNACFTINNYDGTEVPLMQAWSQPSYCVIGKEVGESGTPHLQGYVEFKAQVKFSTFKKKFPTAHIEPRHGTPSQAADYCKKDGDYFEWGEISHQGARSDITAATTMISERKTMREVAIANPEVFVKYHKGLIAFQNILIEPRNEPPQVTVLYGTTGMGKSRRARVLCNGEPYHVWEPHHGQWFDGYTGQKHVIFEEFRGQLPLGMMLCLLDRYECKVQYKGGMVEFAATNIIITSPKHPSMWYHDDETDKIAQLLRRITTIEHLTILEI